MGKMNRQPDNEQRESKLNTKHVRQGTVKTKQEVGHRLKPRQGQVHLTDEQRKDRDAHVRLRRQRMHHKEAKMGTGNTDMTKGWSERARDRGRERG